MFKDFKDAFLATKESFGYFRYSNGCITRSEYGFFLNDTRGQFVGFIQNGKVVVHGKRAKTARKIGADVLYDLNGAMAGVKILKMLHNKNFT